LLARVLGFLSHTDHMSDSPIAPWLDGYHGSRLRTERSSRLLTITLDSPPVNAFDSIAYQELGEVFSVISSASDLSSVLLRADNRCFSAGQDRLDAPTSLTDSPSYLRRAAQTIVEATLCPVPLVVAVRSTAIGAGLILALCADILVVDSDATLSVPGRKYGVISGYAHLLPWIGSIARTAVLTGQPIETQAFLSGGAIVVPTEIVDLEAKRVAESIAEVNPQFICALKSGWNDARNEIARSYLREIEQTIELGSMDFNLNLPVD
jgi:enoyl-CoA hydratase